MSDYLERTDDMLSRSFSEESEDLMRDVWDNSSDTYVSKSEVEDEYDRLARRLGLSGHSDGKRSRRKKYVRICLYAALWIGALCIAGTGVAMISASEEASGEIAGIKFIEHYTAYGEREEFILPDSSRVWLNSGSLIVYPEKFIGKERNVYLSGEGYFKVTKDRKRPFLVQTGDVSVKVLGTSFNISGYAGADEVTTTLESGAVEISVPGDGRVYSLTPDDQMTYTMSSDKVDIRKVDSEDFTSWTGGGLIVNDKTVEETAAMLERIYGKKILIATGKYDDVRITVHFRDNEPLERVLSVIRRVVPGMKVYSHDGITVIM